MSAILSADDLNDFISPGVACIKPVETLPLQKPKDQENAYEVTKGDRPDPSVAPAQISLTDCLACSGCVTSAEAVLVSLQSHTEVLNAIDAYHSLNLPPRSHLLDDDDDEALPDAEETNPVEAEEGGRIFVASISPQVRASLATTYGCFEAEAGNMIDHLLSGPHGLAAGGQKGTHFTWVIDTNAMREASLVLGADEVLSSRSSMALASVQSPDDSRGTSIPTLPILSSACPGWICYTEKSHPYVLPHLSRLKSPQALTGTLLKTVLSRQYNIAPSRIWHLAIMPCFDKKLEASREELTDVYWHPGHETQSRSDPPTRDVDCVITARELLMLADSRGISFPDLPRMPLYHTTAFPDPTLSAFLFPPARRKNQSSRVGTSGGYLEHILSTVLASKPSSSLVTSRGRNADVVEYTITSSSSSLPSEGQQPGPIFKAARYYGFHNIQNLVRKLKPLHLKTSRIPGSRANITNKDAGFKTEYAYVEVMACPGGCTNGGGQIKVEDVDHRIRGSAGQKDWLARVDEAYFSGSDDGSPSPSSLESERSSDVEMGGTDTTTADNNPAVPPSQQQSPNDPIINGISPTYIRAILSHWSTLTNIPLQKLAYTSYRMVESDVGKQPVTEEKEETKKKKKKKGEMSTEHVAQLAGKIGGGW